MWLRSVCNMCDDIPTGTPHWKEEFTQTHMATVLVRQWMSVILCRVQREIDELALVGMVRTSASVVLLSILENASEQSIERVLRLTLSCGPPCQLRKEYVAATCTVSKSWSASTATTVEPLSGMIQDGLAKYCKRTSALHALMFNCA